MLITDYNTSNNMYTEPLVIVSTNTFFSMAKVSTELTIHVGELIYLRH